MINTEFIILSLPHDQVQAMPNVMQDDYDIIIKYLYGYFTAWLQTLEGTKEWFTDFYGSEVGLVPFFLSLLYKFIKTTITN